jgi:hypothetical protein
VRAYGFLVPAERFELPTNGLQSEVGHLLAQRTTNSLKHLVVVSGAPLGRFEAVGVPGLCQEIRTFLVE